MRRLTLLLPLVCVLVLALPALAATPKNGTFKGTGTHKANDGSTATYKATLKVKKGRVTYVEIAATNGSVFIQSQTFSPGLKVRSGGKFSGKKKRRSATATLRGRFTKPGRAVGTFKVVDPKDTTGYGQLPKTKFTVKHK